jgi:hypothetical protein
LEVTIVYQHPLASRAAALILSGMIGACGFFDGTRSDGSADEPSATDATAAIAAEAIAAVDQGTAADVTSTSAPTGSTTTVSKPTTATAPIKPAGTIATPSGTTGATASASLKALTLGTLTSQGPIVIDGGSGATITGRRISNAGGPCIVVRNGATNVRIEGNQIGPCAGHGIEIVGSNTVAVTGNNIAGVGEVGVKIQDSRAVQVRNNFVDGASTAFRGIRSSQVQLEFNGAINIRGRYPDGQLAQLDNVTGTGNRVQCNAADLSIGGPDPATTTATALIRTEDVINTWESKGDPSDPILIAYNRLKGGGSFTGSGIMAGDGGGSNISVIGNRIVDPWNAGIGVAGGSNIRIERNRVFSSLPGLIAGEGFYVRNFSPSACSNITHQNNEINWPPTDWSTAGWVQSYWQPAGECSNVSGASTNNLNATALSRAIFTEPIGECRTLASALGLPTSGY